ncbi:MAG: hypothetical protein H7A53_00860 [Akkermansiaceae bacterium]|nr:hypothetical protein [Akkermansiaceae bacterium]
MPLPGDIPLGILDARQSPSQLVAEIRLTPVLGTKHLDDTQVLLEGLLAVEALLGQLLARAAGV